ncbi:uncharacterized protein LOC129593957 [Paramacrobiotus metropolitanus]|uniref:uncharacterized protein LOC129593957 n=1 Tax=Paramacrobiotus metropolitanus TaxID=2943436 RepID=UPI002445F86F|nr:uncharacterized protein LOC129593957 [Paramacrobiotus metropolitanus]
MCGWETTTCGLLIGCEAASLFVSQWTLKTFTASNLPESQRTVLESSTSRRPQNALPNLLEDVKPTSTLRKLFVPGRPYNFVSLNITFWVYFTGIPGISLVVESKSHDFHENELFANELFGSRHLNLSSDFTPNVWSVQSALLCSAGASTIQINATHTNWLSVVYIDDVVAMADSESSCRITPEDNWLLALEPARKGAIECTFDQIGRATAEHHYPSCGWKDVTHLNILEHIDIPASAGNVLYISHTFLNITVRRDTNTENTALGIILSSEQDKPHMRIRSSAHDFVKEGPGVTNTGITRIEFDYAVYMEPPATGSALEMQWTMHLQGVRRETECSHLGGDFDQYQFLCQIPLWLGYLMENQTVWTHAVIHIPQDIFRLTSPFHYYFDVTAEIRAGTALIALDNVVVTRFNSEPVVIPTDLPGAIVPELSCEVVNGSLCPGWTSWLDVDDGMPKTRLFTSLWQISSGENMCAFTTFQFRSSNETYATPDFLLFVETVTEIGIVTNVTQLVPSKIDQPPPCGVACTEAGMTYYAYFTATNFTRLRIEESFYIPQRMPRWIRTNEKTKNVAENTTIAWIRTTLVSESDVVTGLECRKSQTASTTTTLAPQELELHELVEVLDHLSPAQLPAFVNQFMSAVDSVTTPNKITPHELDDILRIVDVVAGVNLNATSQPEAATTSRNLFQVVSSVFAVEQVMDTTVQESNAYGSRMIQALDQIKQKVVPTTDEQAPVVQPRLATSIRSVTLAAPADIMGLNFSFCVNVAVNNDSEWLPANFFSGDSQPDNNTGIKVYLDADKIRQTWLQSNGNAGNHVVIEVGAFYPPNFATFEYDSNLGTRSARSLAPVIVSGQVPAPAQNTEKIVYVELNLKKLFSDEKLKNYVGAKTYSCVFLKYLQTNRSDPSTTNAEWSGDGCYHVRTYKDSNGDLITQCACDHLTNIGSLIDLCGTNPLYSFDDVAQKALSTVLGTISMVCCTVIIAHILFHTYQSRRFLTPPVFIRLNLAVSLALSHLTMIVGQYLPYSGEGHEDACLTAAIFSQWFLLVSFAWMAVECFRMTHYQINVLAANAELKRLPGDTFRTFFLKSSAFAWGFPLIPVIFAFSFHLDGSYGIVYGSDDQWCWIHPQSFWFLFCTFVMPVVIVLAFNMAAIAHYYYGEHKRKSRKEKNNAKQPETDHSFYDNLIEVVNMFVMLMFLGLGWMLGFLMQAVCQNDVAKEVTSYLFIFINGLQGLYLLMFYARTQGASYLHFWEGLRFVAYIHKEYDVSSRERSYMRGQSEKSSRTTSTYSSKGQAFAEGLRNVFRRATPVVVLTKNSTGSPIKSVEVQSTV